VRLNIQFAFISQQSSVTAFVIVSRDISAHLLYISLLFTLYASG